MSNSTNTLLILKSVTKTFPGVLALNNVDFNLRRGEVHVLLGENGAGKSTLIKIISGAYKKDGGTIFIDGKEIEIHNPRHAQELGIATVYQEFILIPYLSAAENIFLGRQPLRRGPLHTIDKARMNMEASKLLKTLEIDINPKEVVRKLGIAQKQMVEIAKAFSVKSKICIFDEPTAALTPNEIQELFLIIKRLKSEGVGIIYISHRLEEVFAIGDRITVLRNGQYVDTRDADEVQTSDLVEMMIGRKVKEAQIEINRKLGPEILRIENLSGERFKNISLSLRSGEIVGLAGLVGAGRTEVLRAIFGADPLTGGIIYLKGEVVKIKGPKQALKMKIALLPEDRKAHGLIMCRPVDENIILSSLDSVTFFGVLKKGKILKRVKSIVKKLAIKTPSLKQLVIYLSGGNQQKVIIARWLSAECDVLMFDEPTRGIDVGAKQEVHNLMKTLAQQGAGILVVSSEIPELMKICDRIYVMHEGEISAEFPAENVTSDLILNAAFGRQREVV